MQRAVVGGYHRVQSPVIINVADGQPSPNPCFLKHLSSLRGNIHETLSSVSGEHHWFLVTKVWKSKLNRIQVVSLGDEEILPTIVVVIQESHAPTGMLHAHEAESGGIAVVVESAVAIVSIERVNLAGQVGDDQVGQSVVVVVRKVHAHSGVCVTFAVHGYARLQGNFFERAIPSIVVKKFGHGVVGEKQIDAAVAVIVG